MDKILRIIDANFNRSREGLRVIEDAARFYYDMCPDTLRELKDIRHALSKAVSGHFGLAKLKASRDTVTDRGRRLDTRRQQDVASTVEKNFLRAGEAMRVIEEYSKTVSPGASRTFHDLRFRIYSAEKEVIRRICGKKMVFPFLQVSLSSGGSQRDVSARIKAILGGKADIIELQQEGNDDAAFLKKARMIRKMIPPGVIYMVRNRADICALCGADGLSLGKRGIPAREAGRILPGKIFCLHAEGKIEKGTEKDFDYVVLTPSGNGPGDSILTKTAEKIKIPFAVASGKEVKDTFSWLQKGAAGIVFFCSEETHNSMERYIRDIKRGMEKHGKQDR